MAAGLLDTAISIAVWPLVVILLLYRCKQAEDPHAPAPVLAVEQRAAPPPMELGYFPYPGAVEGGARGSAAVCAICLEVLVEGATCSEVPACRHLFHRDCIQLWMKSKNTCPMCRDLIVPGSKPLSAAEDMV